MSFKSVSEPEKNVRVIEFSCDRATFDAAVHEVYLRKVKKMSVPGFRPGKAPQSFVEKIYGINGIGKLMVDAIAGEGIDYHYVLALGILYSALYIGIMLVVDLLYGVLDPRIRVSAKGKEA